MAAASQQDVKGVFRQFDQNDDGVIDRMELKSVLQALSADTWTDAAVDTLLSVMGDESGVIRREEFVDWIFSTDDVRPGTAELLQKIRGTVDEMMPGAHTEAGDGGEEAEAGESEDEGAVDEVADALPPASEDRAPRSSPGGGPTTNVGAAKRGSSSKVKAGGAIAGVVKKKSAYGATVKCEKTIDLGKAVRSAICIGHQVWTVDWQGAVAIRDRDDAAKILGEIPTQRFVWSMMHMKPGLMWMGQEAHGIGLFDSKKLEHKATLTGGHVGGVLCIAMDDSLGEEDGEAAFPVRQAWSGSNDFTIREWCIRTWLSKEKAPLEVSGNKDSVVSDLGKWKVGICKGRHMFGHKNGVKVLLKLGPILWSGSDDGTIRLWRCVGGECLEVVEEAHQGTVNRLAVVRSFVWSAGSDGVVKEWTMGGAVRQCVRRVAPPGSEKGIYSLLPLGVSDVWVCGHHPSIQVFSQSDMSQTSEEEGHKPFVSNLIAVDRVETKIVWSTSIGDRKLKVWRYTTRGEVSSVDELKAANLLYQQEEQTQSDRLGESLRKLSSQEQDAQESLEAQRLELEGSAKDLAESRSRCEDLDELRRRLEGELAEFRNAFQEAGLGHLLDDPSALTAFVERAARLEAALRTAGLEHLLATPELAEALKMMAQLKDILERCGFTDVLEDPSKLEAILTRYSALKKVFEENGHASLFDHPQKLHAFLNQDGEVRSAFRDFQLEHLLDDAQEARDFLKKRAEDEHELLELRERVARLEGVEARLGQQDRELAERIAEGQSDRDQLARLRQVFEDAGQSKLLEESIDVETSAGDVLLEEDLSDIAEEEDAQGAQEQEDEDAADEEDEVEGEEEEGDEDDEDNEEDEDNDEDAQEDTDGGEIQKKTKGGKTLKDQAAKTPDAIDSDSKESQLPTVAKTSKPPSPKRERVKPAISRPAFPKLKAYLERNNAIEKELRGLGLEHLLDDPHELGRLLNFLQQITKVLRDNGLEEIERDPSLLVEVLSRYSGLKAAFELYDYGELFEDPDSLKFFLRVCRKMREEFAKAGLEHLMDSTRELGKFLARYKEMEQELKDIKEAAAGEKLAQRDVEMTRLENKLAKQEAEISSLQKTLAEYEQLGDLEAIRKWKADAEELRRLQRMYAKVQGELRDTEKMLADQEKEREEALARERMMSVKYKELDIFKLDVIARELKGIDKELGLLGTSVKDLQQDTERLKNYDERQHIANSGDKMMDQCKGMRGHIRDVINKCLSETQKMHIGIAIDDHTAAGVLTDGGTMVGVVYEEVERPDHGNSRAAKLRQHDEIHRKRPGGGAS